MTERCFEQLKLDLGYESRNAFVVSVGSSYDYSALGVTHHCPNDLNIVSSIPNFRVFCPGNFSDFTRIVDANLEVQAPKYIRVSEYENTLNENCEDLCLLQSNTNGVVIVVGNSVMDFGALVNARVNATILYTWNVSEFDIIKFKYIVEALGIKTNITVIEPSFPTNIINKICTNLRNVNRIESIAVPFGFIDHYGTKPEIDRHLGLDDTGIISRLKAIYNEH